MSTSFNAEGLWRRDPEPSEVEWTASCNSYLDLECWDPSPWTADQRVNLRNVIEIAAQTTITNSTEIAKGSLVAEANRRALLKKSGRIRRSQWQAISSKLGGKASCTVIEITEYCEPDHLRPTATAPQSNCRKRQHTTIEITVMKLSKFGLAGLFLLSGASLASLDSYTAHAQNLPGGKPIGPVNGLNPAILNAKCDIKLSWKYAPVGNHASGDTLSAGGSGSSATANGIHETGRGKYIAARPVFTNVGDRICAKFSTASFISMRVDGAASGTFVRNTTNVPVLSPGQSYEGSRVIAEVPCPIGGGVVSARNQRLNWDTNQRNNTYELIFKTKKGPDGYCPGR